MMTTICPPSNRSTSSSSLSTKVSSRIQTNNKNTIGNNTGAEMDIVEPKEEKPHPPPQQQTATEKLAAGVLEARKSLMKVLMEHRFKQRFSSTALTLDSSVGHSSVTTEDGGGMGARQHHSLLPYSSHHNNNDFLVVAASNSFTSCSSAEHRPVQQHHQPQLPQHPARMMSSDGGESPSITQEERKYLEKLILEGDVATLEAARDRLQDTTLFPTNDMMMMESSPSRTDLPPPTAAELSPLRPTAGAATASSAHNTNNKEVVATRPPPATSRGKLSKNTNSSNKPTREPPKRRDSKVQQRLFQIHQEKKVQPSRVLQYLKHNSLLQSSESLNDSSELAVLTNKNPLPWSSSSTMTNGVDTTDKSRLGKNNLDDADSAVVKQQLQDSHSLSAPEQEDSREHDPLVEPAESKGTVVGQDASSPSILQQQEEEEEEEEEPHSSSLEDSFTEVDPFKDIASWIDGGQGVEVNDSGIPLIERTTSSASSSRSTSHSKKGGGGDTCTTPSRKHHHHLESDLHASTCRPFRILGTSADDVSCHPHVLSPPLMESLLAFMPEGLMNCNYWIKYSLVRDGASMWTMMRKVRSSNATVLAIETVDGHVFGAFTNHSWRFSVGWYGGQQAFLWKMRRSRLETTTSIFEQAVQESEVQVFPVRPGNVAVQYCSKDCLMLGRGEIQGHAGGSGGGSSSSSNSKHLGGGKHYGHGIYLDSTLLRGTTSSSETFGNPCLVDDAERGTRFEVSNIEIWTLTPHDTVNEAQQSELSTMFLEGGREGDNLNLLGILVGGPI